MLNINSNGEKSAAATKRIYELCDVGHKQNRVPMVCSGKYDVLTPLVGCLTQESGDGRHFACLALNNLSMPTENKRVMALGPASKDVIGGLCKVIAEDKQESYLCCICLMNLSFLEASITSILLHSPSGNGKEIAPPDNPESLLRVVEKLVQNSTQNPEGARWASGLLMNLSKSEENAVMISRTNIPNYMVEIIRAVKTPRSQWTSNTLEDFSLFIVLSLAQWPYARETLIDADAVNVIQPIMSEGGLQGLKATMASIFLAAEWVAFPDSGAPAAKCVSELMDNIMQEKGKHEEYSHAVFTLPTATRAFHGLVKIAAMANGGDHSQSNIRALASPLAVAVNIQVVSGFVVATTLNSSLTNSDSNNAPSAFCASFAVDSLEVMLPTILQAADPPRTSSESTKATSEISLMLSAYADTLSDYDQARARARSMADKIKNASESACPILESAHDLWTQLRKRKGQPTDQFFLWTS
jgi:hypothetical protein